MTATRGAGSSIDPSGPWPAAPTTRGRLVVVSNRVSGASASGRSGGLVTVLDEALEGRDALWLGWDGRLGAGAPDRRRDRRLSTTTFALPREDAAGYYDQRANTQVWPAFHGLVDRIAPLSLAAARGAIDAADRVVARFAEHLADEVRAGDVVWVQDHHLIALAQHARDLGLGLPIGFFLHTPFPDRASLAALAGARALVQSLSSYDLVGLQTDADVERFVDAARALGAVPEDAPPERAEAANDDGSAPVRHLRWAGRRVACGAFPVGVDADAVAHRARTGAALERVAGMVARAPARPLIVGCDRLDYTKGIPQRLDAFARLLRRWGAAASDASTTPLLLQLSQPTRPGAAGYGALAAEVARGAKAVRAAAHDGPDVLRHVVGHLTPVELAGCLRHATVALVTPLRDGMNLVAKEFVAAQDPQSPGCLVLSRHAGAARQLDAAVLVDPLDPQSMDRGLQRALAMGLDERRERWQAMRQALAGDGGRRWRQRFEGALATCGHDSCVRAPALPVAPVAPDAARNGSMSRATAARAA